MNINGSSGSGFFVDALGSFLIIALLVAGINLVSGRSTSGESTMASRSPNVKNSATFSKQFYVSLKQLSARFSEPRRDKVN